ncbi:nSTAND1 domain-containing NTPase [Hymenobacter ruricola]|uniref:ATP-binding protein n=1 Tax=Hymenobacter ruricola TaxID=2791023 RepID=A0ABS0I0C7_9BACT|nr:AAA family ATPase [Hymenobacter ruricola]MBF9220405.1 ATP-binding protein [Hymenobacter ruricola]
MNAGAPNPYKGLFRYTAEDESRFFGREQEVKDVIEMVQAKPLVTLYGESGTGKTSLIHAKLFPELNRKYFFTVYIRINFTDKKTPLQQVREIMNAELKKFSQEAQPPHFEETATLLESASNTCLFGGLVKPVLFFDQFEELFTLGPKHQSRQELTEFVEQLSDLVEVRSGKVAATGKSAMTTDELTRNALNFRTVISLRQDYVGYLDDLKFDLPSLLYGKYHLKKFTIAQAREAIRGPLRDQQVAGGEPAGIQLSVENVGLIVRQMGVSSALISESLSDEGAPAAKPYASSSIIDPTLLSLFCYEVFNKVQAVLQKAVSPDATSVGPDYNAVFREVITSANVEDTIGQYYEKHLAHLQLLKEAIEAQLINDDGKRLLVPLATFSEKSGIAKSAVENLIQESALLKDYGDNDKKEIEIVHDQVAKYVLLSKKKRDAAQAAAGFAAKVRKRALVSTGVFSLVALIAVGIYVIYQRGQYNVIALRDSNSALETKLDNTQNELRQQQEAASTLSQKVTILNKEFEAKIGAANQRFDAIRRSDANLQRTLQDTIALLKKRNVNLKLKNSGLTNQVMEKDRMIKIFKASLEMSGKDNTYLNHRADSLQRRANTYAEEIKKLRADTETPRPSPEQVRRPTASETGSSPLLNKSNSGTGNKTKQSPKKN